MIVRPAREDDAEQLVAFVHDLAAEPANNILWGPGEFAMTLEQEREFLASMARAPNSVFLVAVDGDRIVGSVDAHGGRRVANRHAATLGISVARDHRGKGAGTLLMQALVDWARKAGIRRLELNVFARNAIAIRLYQRFGFAVEGRRSRSAFKEGEYLDDLLMAKILDGELQIEEVEARSIVGLRRQVLRPDRPLAESRYAEDDSEATIHVAAFEDSALIGCATALRQALADDARPAYRLRGMAVLEGHRNRGIGGQLLGAIEERVVARDIRLMWCNGRVAAGAFYRRHGWVDQGGVFDVIGIPHQVLCKELPNFTKGRPAFNA